MVEPKDLLLGEKLNMTAPFRSSSIKIALILCFTLLSITLLAGVASAQAVGFTITPPSGQYTIEGCRNDGSITLPSTNNAEGGGFVCPDAAYTTGNLGKGWNELDLVPFRLTTTTDAQATKTTYDIIIAGEYTDVGHLGWDVIGSDAETAAIGHTSVGSTTFSSGPGPTRDPISDGSCAAHWNGYFVNGPSLSGSTNSIYRVLQVTQAAGSTCIWDYYMRLALGSHLYPGSSLHGFIAQTANFTGGEKDVPLPVKQIAPQGFSKSMAATQGSSSQWQIGKQVPAHLDFPNVCLAAAPTPIQINVAWTKTSNPTGVTITTTLTLTNPAARSVTADVTDQIYLGTTQTTPVGPLFDSGAIVIPANTSTTLTHTFVDNVNLSPPSSPAIAYNDSATATYTDTVTGVPEGSLTATATSPVTQVTGTNDTAHITDQEDLTPGGSTGFQFSLDSSDKLPDGTTCTYSGGGTVTNPSGYVVGGGVFVSDLTWLSNSVSGNGTASFCKTVTYGGSGPASGTLSDTSTLTASEGFSTDSGTKQITVSAEALVNLTINKGITPSGAAVTFTFHVFNSAHQEIAYPGGGSAPQIAFPGLGFVELVGLQPDVYTVTEDPVIGWTETDSNSHTIDLTGVSPATCSNSVTFQNSQPDASIAITPNTATNEIGHQHVFTVTVTQASNGATPATTANITTNVSPAPSSMSTTCGTAVPFSGNTATCTITINSTTVQTYTANATAQLTIGTAVLTRSTGDGISGDSGPAVKNYVSGSISIAPSATNEVGHAHVFTVTVTQNPGSATAAATANVTYSVTPTPGTISSTCGTSVPFVGNTATCTITINSTTAGTFTANATATFTVGGVVVTRTTDGTGGDSGPAVKQYVDANIAISPLTANNAVNQPHVFTVTVTEFPAGDAPATTANVTYNVTPAPTSISSTCNSAVPFSGTVATCTITINSSVPQTYTANASATLTIGGVVLVRATGDSKSGDSGPAVKNYLAGQIQVIKNTLPPTIQGTFGYTDGFGVSSLKTVAGTASQLTGYLAPGNAGPIAETTPNNGQLGWALVNAICDNGSTLAAVNVTNGAITHCTFTNATAFVQVIKTLNGGALPAGACGNGSNIINPCQFSFQLRIGASATQAGTILDTLIANSGNGGVLNFTDMLIPGVKYAMCEQLSPGWNTNFGSYSVYNPSGDNSTWCGDFTPASGQTSTTTFNVDNTPPPGGKALTIGFWKNWSSCSGGGQGHTLDKTLFAAQTAFIPWTGLTGPGINVGDLALYTSAKADPDSFCKQAVDVLSKASNSGSKFSSNPAYNVAAQLLGAELNLEAGAGYNACALSLITQANNLLTPAIDGSGHTGIDFSKYFYANTAPKLTTLQTSAANYLQTQLNNYNNNLAYTCNNVF